MAQVAQVAVVILKLAAADGAGREVADNALGLGGVVGQAADGVVDAVGVLRRQTAGDEVVRVEHQLGLGAHVVAHHVEDEIRVGVAAEGVAIEVGHQDDVGRQVRQDLAEGELVQLHDGHVLLGTTGHGCVSDECGLDAVCHIAAGPVVDHLVLVVGEKIVQQVVGGGLAIGARDAHHGLGTRHVGENLRVDLLGNHARKLAAVAVRCRERGLGCLGGSHGQLVPGAAMSISHVRPFLPSRPEGRG